jgi:hypothetical protein
VHAFDGRGVLAMNLSPLTIVVIVIVVLVLLGGITISR